jgi:hypothetical protein
MMITLPKGTRIGLLTVVSEHGRNNRGLVLWLCKCDCGKDVVVTGSALSSSKPTKSCGCLVVEVGRANKKDMSGRRFGRLVVKEEAGRNNWSNVLWGCQCDCGGYAVTTTTKLISGHTRSCGCIKKERIKKIGKERRVFATKKELMGAPLKGSSVLFRRIPTCDFPSVKNGLVRVACKMCGKLFNPTYQQVNARTASFHGNSHGENNFYCSDKCKDTCPVFNHKTNRPDPRLMKPKTETEVARSCQTSSLKKIQCDRNNGQSYCEKCGDFIDVELHHTLSVAEFGSESINSAGHMLLCAGCHVELHRLCA